MRRRRSHIRMMSDASTKKHTGNDKDSINSNVTDKLLMSSKGWEERKKRRQAALMLTEKDRASGKFDTVVDWLPMKNNGVVW